MDADSDDDEDDKDDAVLGTFLFKVFMGFYVFCYNVTLCLVLIYLVNCCKL